jgi:hypothetical protein
VTVGFPHTFGPDVDLYKLELGDDWRYAKQESALACYVHTSLEKAQLALFWRTP